MRKLYGGITELIDKKLHVKETVVEIVEGRVGETVRENIGLTYLEIEEGLPHFDSGFIEKNLEKLVLKGYLVDKEHNGEFFETDKKLTSTKEIRENVFYAVVGGACAILASPFIWLICSAVPEIGEDE